MSEGRDDLKTRKKAFALGVIGLTDALPRNQKGYVLGRQLLRCGTSVGANYRAACRAKSGADFINKMTIVEEELDEAAYWMELLVECGLIAEKSTDSLVRECGELLAMTVASIKTARGGSR